MKFLLKFLLVFVFCVNAFAYIGEVKKTVGFVNVERKNIKTELKAGDKIYQNDLITTGNKSFVSIIFSDKTQFRLGSNSNLSIQQYLYDKSKKSKMIFSSSEGSLDIVSGDISRVAKNNFKMHSNTLVIGIRGTRFNLDSSTQAYGCQNGAINVVSKLDGKSVDILEDQMVLYDNNGFSKVMPFDSKKFGILKENWLNSGKFDRTRQEERKTQRQEELEKAKQRKALREELENKF